ncbi:hypothetical protein [Phenylobacterium sp.]|uniref:hypothetical protein n=1 Tax=Phenylobacterium sp. TaxID=1871053 RepID=UPI002C82F00A|nr:hypothetical protein [Phenylobacterium sp.]HLZ77589.1 hypothetical protein [Phenylobacterium sp.]
MDRRPPQEFAGDREPQLTADEIERLMSGPIKEWPSIIIVGDEDVVGYNPPRPHPAGADG